MSLKKEERIAVTEFAYNTRADRLSYIEGRQRYFKLGLKKAAMLFTHSGSSKKNREYYNYRDTNID